jgi:IS605 OrfB family transposase
LNFVNIKTLKLEDIKNLRKGRKSSRWLSHWTYTILFDKLELTCKKFGVQIEKVSPTYTSQRCSQCGWVRKSNRQRKKFRCTACGFTCDADLNASKNIVLNLPAISKKKRLQHDNKLGFYWNVVDQEIIVPNAKKL